MNINQAEFVISASKISQCPPADKADTTKSHHTKKFHGLNVLTSGIFALLRYNISIDRRF